MLMTAPRNIIHYLYMYPYINTQYKSKPYYGIRDAGP